MTNFAERDANVRAMRRAADRARMAALPDGSEATEAEFNAKTEKANSDYAAAMEIVNAAQSELDAECAAQPQPQGWIYGNE